MNLKGQRQVKAKGSKDEIRELMRFAGVAESGQVQLYDGRTGDPFAEQVTVGVGR